MFRASNEIPRNKVNSKEQNLRRTTVICPKCGEDNANNFRFCGMCGAVLEKAMPASAPKAETMREGVPVALTIPANPPKAGVEKRVEPVNGAAMPGLGGPTLDSLREKALSGADPFFELEQPKTGGRKILLLVLLAALGAAIWWTYTNYAAIGENQKQPGAAVSQAGTDEVPAEKPAAQQQAPQTKSADAPPPSPSPSEQAPSPAAGQTPPAKTSASPESKPQGAAAVVAAKPRTLEKTASVAAMAKPGQHTTVRADRTAVLAPKPAVTVTAADTGDAAFRKGEAYLYGRGVPENCDEAIKNLKAASAKLHARARSTFGTMYATGHCVSRDLPTAYSWFALALQADPNNQILEKDLSAIWNQMTPPERQMATKKQ